MNGRNDAARISLKHVFATSIADLPNDLACNILNVEICLRFHFAGQYHLAGSDHGLTRHFRTWIVSEEIVDERVRYLIGNLVGVALRNRLRRE